MRTCSRAWITAAMVVATAAAGARLAAAQPAAICVDIRDHAGNSTSVLQDVRSGLSDIFRHAGVSVVSEGAPRYTVNIVSSEIARQLGEFTERMGFAPVGAGGRIVYVLDAQVSSAVTTGKTEKAAILAAVTAHELGHLILPPHAHVPNGLMRPVWNDADFLQVAQGALLFPSSQAAQLRKSLTTN